MPQACRSPTGNRGACAPVGTFCLLLLWAQTEETPGWLCPFRAEGGEGRSSRQPPHSCFPKWAVDQEQGEVRGSPSQEGKPGAGVVGITRRSRQTHHFFMSSSTNISPPSISAPHAGRVEGSGRFYDVNHRVFTLLRTCLLSKTSLKWRHSSSVYLNISKLTFLVLMSLKKVLRCERLKQL